MAAEGGAGMSSEVKPARLPVCTIQPPSCGACYGDTRWEGESFQCEDCGLDYGRGGDGVQATYIDEEAQPCGKACTNTWHVQGVDRPGGLVRYDCEPCKLPAGHPSSFCWTDCEPRMPVKSWGPPHDRSADRR